MPGHHSGCLPARSFWVNEGIHLTSALSVDGNITAIAMRPPLLSGAGIGAQYRQQIPSNSRAWKSTSAMTSAASGEKGTSPGEKYICFEWQPGRNIRRKQPWWSQSGFPVPHLPLYFLQIPISRSSHLSSFVLQHFPIQPDQPERFPCRILIASALVTSFSHPLGFTFFLCCREVQPPLKLPSSYKLWRAVFLSVSKCKK